MVNLLVVAALLAPCLAWNITINIDKFSVLCMKQDGSYVPIANSRVWAADYGKPFNVQHDFLKGAIATDRKGVINNVKTHYHNDEVIDNSRGFQLWLNIDCATYRKQCPAVENICQFIEPPYVSVQLASAFEALDFEGGVYALITPRNEIMVPSKVLLPTTAMTLDQFCEPPYGISEVRECHWRSVQKRSSNIDNGAATADFNKGRPARLAKRLF